MDQGRKTRWQDYQHRVSDWFPGAWVLARSSTYKRKRASQDEDRTLGNTLSDLELAASSTTEEKLCSSL